MRWKRRKRRSPPNDVRETLASHCARGRRAEWRRQTTFATEYLPGFAESREFLNADLIAAGLSPFALETQNMRAGRLLLERMHELVEERSDFGFETTLAAGRGGVPCWR